MQAESTEASLKAAKEALKAEQAAAEQVHRAACQEQADIAQQGAALLDMGKQVSCNCSITHKQTAKT